MQHQLHVTALGTEPSPAVLTCHLDQIIRSDRWLQASKAKLGKQLARPGGAAQLYFLQRLLLNRHTYGFDVTT
jgi:hypothetical protein